MVSKERAKEILKIYEEAWVEQDIDKILSIFSVNGVYHERVFKEAHKGHTAISEYWRKKVCEEQSNIEFQLLNIFVDGDTIIAEWDASFDDTIKKKRLHLREVAIMEIKDDLIQNYREFWHSEEINS